MWRIRDKAGTDGGREETAHQLLCFSLAGTAIKASSHEKDQRADFVLTKSSISPSVCLRSSGTHKPQNCTRGKLSSSFALMNSRRSGKSAHFSSITSPMLLSPPTRGASHLAQALGCHVTFGPHFLFILKGGWPRFGVPTFTSSDP